MILSILVLSLSIPASADTLYYAEFTSAPFGWEAGPLWEWVDSSAFLHLYCWSSSGFVWQNDNMSSLYISLPYQIDSLEVIFEHKFYTFGGGHAPGEWSRSTMSLGVVINSSVQVSLWEIVFSDEEFRGFSASDSCTVITQLHEVEAGDVLRFWFTGKVEAHAIYEHANSYLDWNIYSFYLLAYPPAILEQSTWGSIKASI